MNRESLKESVRQNLRRVRNSRLDEDVLEAEMVDRLEVSPAGDVELRLRLDPRDPSHLPGAVRDAAAGVEGVTSVRVDVRSPAGDAGPGSGDPGGSGDSPDEEEGVSPGPAAAGSPDAGGGAGGREDGPGRESQGPRQGSGRSLPVVGPGGGEPEGQSPPEGPGGPAPDSQPVSREEASRHPSEAEELEGVEHVLAVSSGKGGVGKSTVATNLAAAWADEGHRVGLLDADIYGPDIPTMFGVHDRPRMAGEQVIPLEAHGVRLMSIGFLVDEDTPAIWRGPIIMGIVRQFLQQVQWGELDYLVVDLPPGTGDAQLSLAQLVRLSGGVMVTTPQDVAVGGVLKGIRMFEKLDVPVAGVVENMRGFVCPDCGASHDIFGSGGGEKLAASLALDFLGAIPLGVAVREEGDRGIPTVLGRPESPEGEAFRALAGRTAERLEELAESGADRAGEGEEAGSAAPS